MTYETSVLEQLSLRPNVVAAKRGTTPHIGKSGMTARTSCVCRESKIISDG